MSNLDFNLKCGQKAAEYLIRGTTELQSLFTLSKVYLASREAMLFLGLSVGF